MDRWLVNVTKEQTPSASNPPEPTVDDDDVASCSENPKKKKKVVYFQTKWIQQYPWLEEDPQEKFKRCKYCKTNIAGGKTHLDRHEPTSTHQKAYMAAKTSLKIDTIATKKSCKLSENSRRLEIALTIFVAEHNLPFSVLDHLSGLLKKNIDDSNIVQHFLLNRHKGQKIIKDLLAPENSKIISTLANQQYFSLIIDESTDLTVCTNLAIIIRIFNVKSQDLFLALRTIEDGTAQGIFNVIRQVFEEKEIQFKNLVGFTADNCSVMMGKKNGVQAKIKEVAPNAVINGCICHNLNLSAKAASIHLPSYIDNFIRAVSFHFCNSASRRDEFKTFQKYFGTELHTIISYNATRWLSREAAINRIIEQWDALKYYFQLADFETFSSNEKLNFISTNLNSTTKLYFYFLSYVLGLINKLNLEMQAEDVRIHVLLPRVKSLFKQICRNFIEKNVIDVEDLYVLNLSDNHIAIENVYCGDLAETFCLENRISLQDILEFKTDVIKYYISLLEDLKKRTDLNNLFLNSLVYFSPEAAVCGKFNSILKFIFNFFPNEIKNSQQINNEYREIADYEQLKQFKTKSISEFWTEVGLMKNECNEFLFKNIYRIVQGVLSVPHSSANVERIFSYQNLIKTKCRNRLQVETLSAVIETKNLIKNSSCCDYNIHSDMLQKNVTKDIKSVDDLLD